MSTEKPSSDDVLAKYLNPDFISYEPELVEALEEAIRQRNEAVAGAKEIAASMDETIKYALCRAVAYREALEFAYSSHEIKPAILVSDVSADCIVRKMVKRLNAAEKLASAVTQWFTVSRTDEDWKKVLTTLKTFQAARL